MAEIGDYLRKHNGNMPQEVVKRVEDIPMLVVTMLRVLLGTEIIQEIKQIPLAQKKRMSWVYLI